MIDEKEKRECLKYEDIIPFLPDSVDSDQPPDVQKYMKEWQEKTYRRYVFRVNFIYDQLKAVWPSGTPLEYYFAYVHFSSKSEDELIELLQNQSTIREIVKLATSKKANLEKIKKDIQNEKKKSSNWSETEISTFIKLLSRKNTLKTWKNVSKNFKNKTKEDCFLLFKKLNANGQLSEKFVPKKDIDLPDENDESQFDEIKGLFLEFHDQHSIVGPFLESRKELARDSPLYGHTDLITNDRMFLPAISEYGTVLDYSSWIKIISDTHLDPIARKYIQNNRQITIITNENYSEFKDLIKNIGDKK